MSDLISRRETVSELEEMCTSGALTIGEQNLIKDIIGRIEKQQIAYDVEKAVQELDSASSGRSYHDYAEKGIVHGYLEKDNVVEIVRKGGVD